MKNVAFVVDRIKQSVPAIEAARALGLRVDRHGRCACPIHNGRDCNMRLYPDDRGFNCFVCGASGDVIWLVKAVNGCSFPEAVRWLNSAFHLGLPLDRPLDKNAAEAAQKARKRRQEERERKEALDRMVFDLYLDMVKLCGDLEADAERYRPTKPDQEWDERFCAALRLLPEARDTCEQLATDVIGRKE